jgi:hypothetical protein
LFFVREERGIGREVVILISRVSSTGVQDLKRAAWHICSAPEGRTWRPQAGREDRRGGANCRATPVPSLKPIE